MVVKTEGPGYTRDTVHEQEWRALSQLKKYMTLLSLRDREAFSN
jgi:hypothetical protein